VRQIKPVQLAFERTLI